MGYSHLSLVVMLFILSTASAISPVEITIDPESQTVEKGQELTINISIDPVNNPISAAQFSLLFNNSSIEIRNITEGSLFGQNGANTMFNSGSINNTEGTLTYVWGLIITPGANVTAKGNLATITMYSNDTGISRINLTDVIVSNPDSQAVQINITNGSINVPEYDIVPPASIVNLQNTSYAAAHINWTWNDPLDHDFSIVMIYLNGAFQKNVTRNTQYYNATGLTPDTVYTISTRTVDTSDNINSTWVNHTVSTSPYILSGRVTNASSGLGIGGAVVKLVDLHYNATTSSTGDYSMGVPAGVHKVSVSAAGYTKNVSTVNIAGSVTRDFSLYAGSISGDYRYYAMVDNEITSNKISTLSDVGTSFVIPQYGDNVGWDTEVYVTDYSGLGANMTAGYYYPDGTLAVIENMVVPASGTYKWIPSDGAGSRPTTGKLVITSNRDVVGEFRIYSRSNTDMISSKLYTAADTGTNFIIPQYGDHAGWDTWVAISDVSGSGASLTLKYYRSDGTLAVTENPSIPANGMYTFIPSDGTGGRPTTGRLVITSTNSVAGEYRIYSLGKGGILSNKLFTDTDKENRFIIPQYGDHTGWDTWVVISDVLGLGANLTIEYYYPNGTLAAIENSNVPANGMYTFIPSDSTNRRPALGKLIISSDNLVTGEMRIYALSGRGILSESLYTQKDISRVAVVPYYGDNINFGTYMNLADLSGYNTSVRMDYHYLNGTLAMTGYRTIPADGLTGWVVSDGTSSIPAEGNIFIYT